MYLYKFLIKNNQVRVKFLDQINKTNITTFNLKQKKSIWGKKTDHDSMLTVILCLALNDVTEYALLHSQTSYVFVYYNSKVWGQYDYFLFFKLPGSLDPK